MNKTTFHVRLDFEVKWDYVLYEKYDPVECLETLYLFFLWINHSTKRASIA